MASPQVHHLFHHPIADHSFSADRSTLAVARDNNVELYASAGGSFKLKDELKGHDKTVTGVDIAPNSGMIVTCSQGTPLLYIPPFTPLIAYRPQCLRLGANPFRLEAHACAPPHQPRCYLCALVTQREEVRCRLRRPLNCRVLL